MLPTHRADEAVSAPRHGFDVLRLSRVIVQRRAERAHGRLEHRIADEAVTPYGVEQCVLRDECSWCAGECAEHCEWPGRERYGLTVAREPRVRFVQLECSEPQA